MALQGQRGAETASRGLTASLRGVASTVFAILHSRAELLTLELERERLRITRLVLLCAAALFFLMLGALTATLLIIAFFWDSHRLLTMGLLATLYVCLGIAAAVFARREAARRRRPFASTVAELKKDRDRFSGD